jgi:hypothetical protein
LRHYHTFSLNAGSPQDCRSLARNWRYQDVRRDSRVATQRTEEARMERIDQIVRSDLAFVRLRFRLAAR